MYELKPTGQFKKDLKLCQRRGCDMQNIKMVLEFLKNDGQVPAEYLPHKLEGRNNKVFGSATFSPIGCWFMIFKKRCVW